MKNLNSALKVYYKDADMGSPAFMRVAHSVKMAMANELIMPGAPVPSIRDLSDLFEINPMTASKSIKNLSDLGLISREIGKRYMMVAGAESLSRNEIVGNLKDITLKYLVDTTKHLDIKRTTLNKWIKEAEGDKF